MRTSPLVVIVSWHGMWEKIRHICRKFDISVCGLSDQGQDWLHYILSLAAVARSTAVEENWAINPPCISNITHTPVIKSIHLFTHMHVLVAT